MTTKSHVNCKAQLYSAIFSFMRTTQVANGKKKFDKCLVCADWTVTGAKPDDSCKADCKNVVYDPDNNAVAFNTLDSKLLQNGVCPKCSTGPNVMDACGKCGTTNDCPLDCNGDPKGQAKVYDTPSLVS